MNRGGKVGALLLVASLGAACGGAPDRSEVLADLASDAIIPAYRQFQAEASGMHDAISAFCAAPDSGGLGNARNALDGARRAWSRTEAMWVGPVMERRSWSLVRWPVAPDEIEDLIGDTGIGLDRERLATRIGSDQRGLGAVEYLLHAGEDVLAALSDPRRCEYAERVAGIIADEAGLLLADWTTAWEGGAPYREEFSDAEGDGLDSLVNDAFFVLESITDVELGAALGLMDRPARPEAIREGASGGGVADLTERLLGLQSALVGGDNGSGLDPLLGEELAGRLRSQIAAALQAVAAIPAPLRQAVIDSPSVVGAARDAVKAVQITVATEVVGRLGVAIGFSDADGDSSG